MQHTTQFFKLSTYCHAWQLCLRAAVLAGFWAASLLLVVMTMTLGAQDTKEVSAKVLTMMSIGDSEYLAASSVDKEQFQKMITEMVAGMDANGDALKGARYPQPVSFQIRMIKNNLKKYVFIFLY